MKILMIAKSVYQTDIRVRREAETLTRAGHEVTVICLDGADHSSKGVTVLGVGIVPGLTASRSRKRGPAYRAARWMLLPYHRRLSNRQFSGSVRETVEKRDLTADIIHAHDFPALPVARSLADKMAAGLVYDAHEFWPGMLRQGRPTPLQAYLDERREMTLARTADASITISEAAAEVLTRRYGLERVTVVRNTFPVKPGLRGPEITRGAVYAGRISNGRDLDTVFGAEVWQKTPSFQLHLMGAPDGSVGIPPFALLHPPSDLDEVDRLLTEVGIGLVPLSSGWLNHAVALPNKLFQAVSVGVPVVAADLPEISKLVRHHRLGTLFTPGSPDSFGRAIKKVRQHYEDFTIGVREAQPDLDWSVDASRLNAVYQSLETKTSLQP